MCVCVCVRVIAHPNRVHHTTTPAHLHGVLQVPGGSTEAVECVVLTNRVDPLTARGHHARYKVSSTALARRESTDNLKGRRVGTSMLPFDAMNNSAHSIVHETGLCTYELLLPTSHHTAHLTSHPAPSHSTLHPSHLILHPSHLILHPSHLILHPSHLILHLSHLTLHPAPLTPHP